MKLFLYLFLLFTLLQVKGQTLKEFNLLNESQIIANSKVMSFDYDYDNDQDILVLGDSYNPILVAFKNDGQGDYSDIDTIDLGDISPSFIDYADLNGDGFIDLYFYHRNSSTAYIYANDGKGNFSEYSEISAKGTQFSDIDDDGDLDLFVLYHLSSPRSSTVSYYENLDGKGTEFSDEIVLLSGLSYDYKRLQVFDANEDGYADVFIGTIGTIWSNALYYYEGSSSKTYTDYLNVGGIIAYKTDFENDGILDVVTAGYHGINRYKVDNGNLVFHKTYFKETGSFHSPQISFGNYDLNYSGITISGYKTYQHGNEIYKKAVPFFASYDEDTDDFSFYKYNLNQPSLDNQGAGSLKAIDVNNDGVEEALYYNSVYRVFIASTGNNSIGGVPQITDALHRVSNIQLHDHNEDGITDIAISTNGIPELINYYGEGDNQFGQNKHALAKHLGFHDFEYIDFDGDGITDLIYSNDNGIYKHEYKTGISELLFNTSSNIASDPGPSTFVIGNFTGDTILDIVAGDSRSHLFLLTQTDSALMDWIDITGNSVANGSSILEVETADLNNDGNADLVARTNKYGREQPRIVIFLNVQGTMQLKQTLYPGQSAAEIDLADMNNDGFIDLVSGTGHWYENDGTGTLSEPHVIDTGGDKITVFDVDLDGDNDVFMASNYGLFLCMNDSLGMRFANTKISTAQYLKIFSGDVNQDGFSELITATSKQVSWHLICSESRDTVTVNVCESYVSPTGKLYVQTGVYLDTLIDFRGCDSVIVTNLNVNNTDSSIFKPKDVITACGNYTWIDGITYTESNSTATYTMTNQFGCDSVIYLDLTINNSTQTIDKQIACSSYTWIDGITYTESNTTATYTMTNQFGCDSIIILDLTINHPVETIDLQSACNSYTWIDGNTYTKSNTTATYALVNQFGCDSVVYLDLTINNSTQTIDKQTACSSYTWIDGNTYTESNTTATYTLVNQFGCDSVITLDLTMANALSSIDSQNACDSYTWSNGVTYTESNNMATQVLTSMHGCDSIITLDLEIFKTKYSQYQDRFCDVYYTHDGNEYLEAGTYTLLYTSIQGCDSIVSLELLKNELLAGDKNCNNLIDPFEIAGDVNGNGIIDNDEFAGDINGNKILDKGEVYGDVNGDMTINFGEVHGDENGNGVLDESEKQTSIILDEIGVNVFFPTTIKDNLTVQLNETNSSVVVSLYSLSGSIYYTNTYQNSSEIKLSMNDLTSGWYIIKLYTGSKTSLLKVYKL